MYQDPILPDDAPPAWDGGGANSAPWSSWDPFDFSGPIKRLFCITD